MAGHFQKPKGLSVGILGSELWVVSWGSPVVSRGLGGLNFPVVSCGLWVIHAKFSAVVVIRRTAHGVCLLLHLRER